MGRKRQRGQRGKPWYWAARDKWCITQGKKKVALLDKLGDYIRGEDNESVALRAWHEMMAMADVPRKGDDAELADVLDLYLQKLAMKATAKTHATYVGYFKDFLAKWPGLRVRDLRPAHLESWWEAHPTWGPSMKNLAGTAFKAALNWAAEPGKGDIIMRNPLKGMELPSVQRRSATVVVKQDEFDRLMALVRSEPLRDILTVLWETGTRPGNLAIATAANLREDGRVLTFDKHNTPDGSSVHKAYKKTNRALHVPLSDAARDVCVRLREKRPTGPLFLTSRGLPWNPSRIANIVRHYAKRAGLEGRFMAYSCRHTKATKMLEARKTDHEVATFLGNTAGVIARNYDHISERMDRQCELANEFSSANAT